MLGSVQYMRQWSIRQEVGQYVGQHISKWLVCQSVDSTLGSGAVCQQYISQWSVHSGVCWIRSPACPHLPGPVPEERSPGHSVLGPLSSCLVPIKWRNLRASCDPGSSITANAKANSSGLTSRDSPAAAIPLRTYIGRKNLWTDKYCSKSCLFLFYLLACYFWLP